MPIKYFNGLRPVLGNKYEGFQQLNRSSIECPAQEIQIYQNLHETEGNIESPLKATEDLREPV